MKAKYSWTILFILLTLQFIAGAQTQDSYDYNLEKTWGVNKNSAGGKIGGFVLKRAERISKNVFKTFGIEIMNVKNPHENRIQSLNGTGNYFIYGKSNYLYALRFQYGRDIILYTKAPQQGVEIKAVFAAGPTIGLVSPYYVEVATNSGSPFNSTFEPYNADDKNQAVENINGSGKILQGLFESKFQLGGNAKVALNFELGASKHQVTGFEVGFLMDAYFKKVVMMPKNENYSIYPTVFFTLFYGRRK